LRPKQKSKPQLMSHALRERYSGLPLLLRASSLEDERPPCQNWQRSRR